jgi:hypothetical protein
MKRKPIRIDWDELEVAFSNHDEELVYYLDMVTGKVVLEGEGGDDDEYEVPEDYNPHAPPPMSDPPRPDDSTRAYVTPMDTAMKLEWMKEFLAKPDNELDADVAARLREAAEADDPAGQLRAILQEAAEARDAWYLHRSDRLHDTMQQWLDEHGVTVIDPAPWA